LSKRSSIITAIDRLSPAVTLSAVRPTAMRLAGALRTVAVALALSAPSLAASVAAPEVANEMPKLRTPASAAPSAADAGSVADASFVDRATVPR